MTGGLHLQGQDGSVIVTFAMSLVLILLVASLAIDVSNFFRHKRQLQTQADAAVLAGGSALTAGCSGNGPVFTAADRFAGVPSSDYNRPKAGADGGVVTREFLTGDPCGQGALEVRVTESKVKWFFPVTAVLGALRADLDISAEARVELKQIDGQGGTLPLALEDEPAATNAWTWLVDEDRSPPVPLPGTVRLLTKGTGGADTVPWTAAPITHDFKQSAVGVRVAVDYSKNSGCAVAAEACVALCGAGQVKCYDGGGPGGLLHIHGYRPETAGAKSEPMLNRVELTAAGCVGTAVFNAGGCSYEVRARIDWVPEIDGTGVTAAQAKARATVTGTLGGVPVTLGPSGDANTWVGTTAAITAPGSAQLRLGWSMSDGAVDGTRKCGDGKGKSPDPCTGAWHGDRARGQLDLATGSATPVHRTFVRDETRSGRIVAASVTEGGAVVNSVTRCSPTTSCPRTLTVSVDLPTELRLGAHRNLTTKTPGSNDGFLDCDPLHEDPKSPVSNGKPRFVHQIANGCNGPRYAVNPGDACPAIGSYGPEDPWLCVASVTGDKTGALDAGFSERIYGTTNPTALDCAASPNRMKSGFVADPPADDRRIVPVMVVPSGALRLSGGTLFPVRTFAYFYLTGWDGNGKCADNEPSQTGDILGHFLHHSRPNDGTVYGTKTCDPSELGGCVPVMTK